MMVKRTTAKWIRKSHRYLGIFLGIQFILWTVSGMYFSWTDLDEIHGDHYKRETVHKPGFEGLMGTDQLELKQPVQNLELLTIGNSPFY